MSERFDVIILGGGPAGEVALNTLAKAGHRLALVEGELIGGECSSWGCIPSKTLLRPAELKGQCAVVDREHQVLIGAWAVAPLASEWIHQAVLAIRAEIPIAVLTDTIVQFPSFSEAFGAALRSLPDEAALVGRDHCAHLRVAEPTAGVR